MRSFKKLSLNRETIGRLTDQRLRTVAGGVETDTCTCNCSPYSGPRGECETANGCTTYNPTGNNCVSGNGCNYSGYTCGGTTAYGC